VTLPHRKLVLGAEFHQSGDHEGAWRLPGAQPHRGTDIAYYQRLSRIAEQGKFDFVFFADFLAFNPSVRYSVRWEMEPLSLLAAIAAVTERIGIVATGSTIFTEPYNIARAFATLDHVSGGRAAWNIVTSGAPAAARDYGYEEVLAHHERYVRAAEYVDVVKRLWDSSDGGRTWPLDHAGQHIDVAGALNVARPPQGYPVLVQAGQSEDGKDFAGRHAEVVFTAQPNLAEGQAFYKEMRGRAQKAGRPPDSIRILPGFLAVIGSTEEEAQRLKDRMDDLIHPGHYEHFLASFGIDLGKYPLDEPLPRKFGDVTNFNGIKSRLSVIETIVADMGGVVTPRQLVRRIAGSRGHILGVGTPAQIADQMALWFNSNAADGFIVKPANLPQGIENFVEHVVPELRKRGIYREDYEGATLREHLGLATPPNPNLQPAAAGASPLKEIA
jgi:FMN-dependent oxidoreductase (nitrilotriacetate monooxygenase family)